MKLVSSVVGTAVAHISSDEVMPPQGISQRDIIQFVSNRYAFSTFPKEGPGIAPQPLLTFQAGLFTSKNERIPILQIAMLPDGDAVMARDTDLAEMVLEDLMEQFDERLGYRFAKSEVHRSFLSQVAVEFNPYFVEGIQPIKAISQLVNNAISPRFAEYKLKRLIFGLDSLDPLSPPPGQPGIEQLVIRDFIIERRAGEPLEKNRFFCAAPLRTGEHIALLEKIEQAGMSQN